MLFRTLRGTCALAGTVCLFVLVTATGAAAQTTMMLQWDPSSSDVGYRVHVGLQSGSYTQHVDVGTATLFSYQSATPGQRYCFAVSAYLLGSQVEGPNSSEVCGYSNAPPTLQNPGDRTSAVGQSVTLQLVGSDPQSQPLTYSASGLPPGLNLMASTGFISGAGTTAGTYYVTVRAFDGTLTATQNFTWLVTSGSTAPPPTDPTSPPPSGAAISIGAPTTGTTYATSSSSISLSGTAGSAIVHVRWANDRGGSGVANGTTNWSVAGIPLAAGANVITITGFDSSYRPTTDSLTVTFGTGGGTGGAETGSSDISIAAPTTGTTYATSSSSIALAGTASSAIVHVRWANDRGGSGVASGTTNWSTPGIPLASGTNVITIIGFDSAYRQMTDSLTVTFGTGGSSGGADTTRPTATITSPTTGSSFSTTSPTITLSGASADNVGVAQVRWANNRGGSGVATGTTSWSVVGIPLAGGDNVITVTAMDAAGNAGTATLNVSYGTGSSPTGAAISIAAPTTGTTYATSSSSISLGGTATSAIVHVRWSNDRGGTGIANGTTNWSVPGIALAPGTNVITIIGFDSAYRQVTDSLTVSYGTSSSPPPSSSEPNPIPTSMLTLAPLPNSDWNATRLTWTDARWPAVDVYRNGMFVTSTPNDGSHTDTVWTGGTFTYQICAAGSTTTCSNFATVTF